MLKSATLRLTGWYLIILMLISAIFSVIIYQITSNEVQTRLERFQTNLQQSTQDQDTLYIFPPSRASDLRAKEEDNASNNVIMQLIYINCSVLVVGGFLSYFLAKRTLSPIEKAHAAQCQFTSDASHELRTPLAAMKAEIEVALKDKDANKSDLQGTLNSNLEEVNKLTKLSNMLLGLSRLDVQKLSLEPVMINSVIIETIKSFAQQSKRINLDIEGKLVVHGNEVAISDLVKILIDNAIKYSPKDSLIDIKLSQSEKYAKFSISNTGKGIEADKLPHIFDRFYRADNSRTENEQKSYGLGLALARNMVNLQNGKISVTSVPNEKTTFAFFIPLEHQAQAKTKN